LEAGKNLSDLSDIFAGVKSVLEARNSKLRVYTEPPSGALQYPCLVMEQDITIDYDVALSGNSWDVRLPATLYVRHGKPEVAWQEIQKYVSPTGTESIKAGVESDNTLNSAVDDSELEGLVVVQRDIDDENRFWTFSARFVIHALETIA
jgi:hypothetical protein